MKKRKLEARRILLAELRGMNSSALHVLLRRGTLAGWTGKNDLGVCLGAQASSFPLNMHDFCFWPLVIVFNSAAAWKFQFTLVLAGSL